MVDDAVIYCRQGEQHVPVTVRVEWLLDGKIDPVMHWGPGCNGNRKIYRINKLGKISAIKWKRGWTLL